MHPTVVILNLQHTMPRLFKIQNLKFNDRVHVEGTNFLFKKASFFRLRQSFSARKRQPQHYRIGKWYENPAKPPTACLYKQTCKALMPIFSLQLKSEHILGALDMLQQNFLNILQSTVSWEKAAPEIKNPMHAKNSGHRYNRRSKIQMHPH